MAKKKSRKIPKQKIYKRVPKLRKIKQKRKS
jgi:hypothetical protein